MKKIHLIAGLPRAGSTLLCQILNSNPNFHVTPTSGVIDMIRNMRTTFSHNPSFKAQNRLDLYENFRMGLKGFLDGYFFDKNIVFDKCRGWTNNLFLLDNILGNDDTKVIFLYRDPVEIVSSIEAKYQETILLENNDEAAAPAAFSTLERRIGTYIGAESIISYPIELLRDAIEMGYLNRIYFVKYYDLTTDTAAILNGIHDFINEPYFKYDLKNVKQSTFEFDGFYNYKFPHTIKEGEIKYKKADVQLSQKYIQIIQERYAPFYKFISEGDVQGLLGIQMANAAENAQFDTENDKEKPSSNPFAISEDVIKPIMPSAEDL